MSQLQIISLENAQTFSSWIKNLPTLKSWEQNLEHYNLYYNL